jgi:hypothetical protein
MPLARYFLYVGGVLLALLFILDACFPRIPVAERAHADLPVIRIHSDRKWPERIVYDTSLPATSLTPIASVQAGVDVPGAIAYVPVRTREREAFAQLQSSDIKQSPPSVSKMPEQKRKRQSKKKRTAPPMVLVARQPHFDWFGNRIW